MSGINYNERSWGIDVASEINLWCQNKNLVIKRASGEITIKNEGNPLFPDIILYGDESAKTIIQGWELKMPDTLIDDDKLIRNATKKANNLNLDSFLVWNVKNAALYKKLDKSDFKIFKQWELNGINKRDDVKPNEHIWKKLLYDILNDLNYCFRNNEIKPVKIIDAMTGDTISDFILSHSSAVTNEIKIHCGKNSNLEANIAVWWSFAKNEYDKKADKNSCLAKLVLMSWMNKLLFANLLKKNQSSAYKIDKIVGDASVEESINIINEISDNCDFKNIFQPQLAEQCIPLLTWKTLKSFNSFLIENRVDNFEPEIVQKILINVINTSSKKVSGQFPTPYNLALFLSLLVIEDKSKNVLDPCCGTGTIIKAAYDLKREYFDEYLSINSLWASDKFTFPLQLAMFSLINPNFMGEIIHIFQEDVIDLFMNKDIIFYNPNTGGIEVIPYPKWNISFQIYLSYNKKILKNLMVILKK